MATINNNGLNFTGRIKKSGITIYNRNEKTIARTATSYQPKRRTRKQFVARQQLSHSSRLWTIMKWSGETLFPAKPTGYARFMNLMWHTKVVFLPQNDTLSEATLLLPRMPVSEGVLPVIEQRLGEVNNTAALITDLTRVKLRPTDKLILYTLRQVVEYDRPKVHIT